MQFLFSSRSSFAWVKLLGSSLFVLTGMFVLCSMLLQLSQKYLIDVEDDSYGCSRTEEVLPLIGDYKILVLAL